MKKILLVLSIALLAAGCSSGTTVSDVPSNVTSRYTGTFNNTPGSQSGTVIIDIQDVNGVVSGNIIFQSSGDNCLRNSTVSGTSTGFNLALSADQTGQRNSVTIEEREPGENGAQGALVSSVTFLIASGVEGTVVTELGNGNIQTRITSAPQETSGTLDMQFTVGGGGSTLSGTYTTTGNVCSNQTGSTHCCRLTFYYGCNGSDRPSCSADEHFYTKFSS